jgi:hypothetical protein
MLPQEPTDVLARQIGGEESPQPYTHCIVGPRDKRVYRALGATDFFL